MPVKKATTKKGAKASTPPASPTRRPVRSARLKAAAAAAAEADRVEAQRSNESNVSNDPVTLKRKHVYDSLEHFRAGRTKGGRSNSHSTLSTNVANIQDQPIVDQNEDVADPIDYIESLRSRSTSKVGRFHDTSLDGTKANYKVTSWNINGLRSWLSKRAGLTFIAEDDADVYCFQETKCGDKKVPAEIRTIPGYFTYWNGSDDGQAGVVCFTKKEPLRVTNGIGIDIYDKENRIITMEFDELFLVNAYIPNSGRELVRLDFRMKWDIDFMKYLKDLDKRKPVILCGDLNVSHKEIDIANPKTNIKNAGFTIGERANFSKLLDAGFVDTFRFLNPEKAHSYTFWTYMKNAREKNIGWRLDYFVISKRLLPKLCDSIIRNDIHGSDHCPISLYMSM